MWRNVFSVCILFVSGEVCASVVKNSEKSPSVPSSRKDRHMFYAGRVVNGKFYLGTYWGYKEVSEQIYYEYMRLQWREWKAREREGRLEEGRPVSIEQLYEDSEFDIPDLKRKSVEDTVILKMMVEALYEQIGRLDPDDQFLISALYLFDEPMTQREVAEELNIDQSTVLRRRDRILNTLHEALKDWED